LITIVRPAGVEQMWQWSWSWTWSSSWPGARRHPQIEAKWLPPPQLSGLNLSR